MWDLAGKVTGYPVYKLLGGHRTKIRAYASTMVGDDYEGGLNNAEAYANYAIECKQQGFTAYKLHTWAEIPWKENTFRAKGNWKRDAEACQAVRDAVGDDMELMLDCYHYYDRFDAYHLGKELEKARFAWLENRWTNTTSLLQVAVRQFGNPRLRPRGGPWQAADPAEWILRGASESAAPARSMWAA